jgi:hypothetical protein
LALLRSFKFLAGSRVQENNFTRAYRAGAEHCSVSDIFCWHGKQLRTFGDDGGTKGFFPSRSGFPVDAAAPASVLCFLP